MPPGSATTPPTQRLDSWKAIADYLGRDVSTAMRWEKHNGLPVRRVPGERSHSVFAYTSEIDVWLAGRAGEPPSAASDETPVAPGRRFTRRHWIAAGFALLVLGSALVALVGNSVRFPWKGESKLVSARLVGRSVTGFDAGGAVLWRYEPAEMQGEGLLARIAVADLDGDGRPEVVAAVSVSSLAEKAFSEIVVLDDAGRLRWRRPLDYRYVYGGVEYGPEWFPDDLIEYGTPGPGARVAVALHHHTWWPDVVATFDPYGHPQGRFVNAGWILRLSTTRDLRYLLAAGLNNSLGGAALAVLDAQNVSGASPPDGGTLPPCANCPAGAPHAYFVAPWSDIARPSDTPPVSLHVAESGQIELRAVQRRWADGPVPEIILSVSPSLQVTHRGVSDSFLTLHRVLEREGTLTHPADTCPWRTPPIREWTPALGWYEIP